MTGLLSKDEFVRVHVSAANEVARRLRMPPLSPAEVDGLYAQYVRGNGSLFAVQEDDAHGG